MIRPLLRAGLEVIPDAVPGSAIPHVLGYERERVFGFCLVEYDDPRFVERLNKAWYDLATSSGLIDENREFLLKLPRGTWTAEEDRQRRRRTRRVWHRVRLLERWDIMGAGAATFLGIRAGHPGFAMLALDNSVWLLADTYETGAAVYAVRDPAGSPGVLRELKWELEWLARKDEDREFRREVSVWLESRQQRSAIPGRQGSCDDPAVSYDLAVWDGELPPDDHEAGSAYNELYERYLESDDVVIPPAPRIVDYVEALLDRYPDDIDGKMVWASPPVINEASGPIVYLVMSYSEAEEVSEYAASLAREHGFVCYDPQGETLRP